MKQLPIIALLAAILGTLVWGITTKKPGEPFLGISDAVRLTAATYTVTTTQDALPVKVLARNPQRQYVSITNDSDTVVYLYMGNFTDAVAASTTVILNNGIRLSASGGQYELLLNSKLNIDDLWATSTAASKKLIIVEN